MKTRRKKEVTWRM